MLVYAVDLGTSNTKVVLYDETLHRLAEHHAPSPQTRHGGHVEFDPSQLFALVIRLIGQCARAHGDTSGQPAFIAVTGQAESFVLLDATGVAVRPGMSWLDVRATVQAQEIAERFDADQAFAITGEPASSPTWPAAKLRWLSQHEPDSLERCDAVLMVKDDLIRRLTGSMVAEATTRGFTYFYDVAQGRYWQDMLDFCGVDRDALAPVVGAGSAVGTVLPDVVGQLPPAASWRVNAGALDHFCAMVGTGSYRHDVVSESSGTVLSLSVLPSEWSFDAAHKVSFHHGLHPGEVVQFTCADSGGVVLEWFRREGLAGMDHADLERALANRAPGGAPIFLPYLTGVNPPDFLPDARGAFVGLQLEHDRIDMAFAAEEGLAHLLRRNVDHLGAGGCVEAVVSTGGGSVSAFRSQLKADVCGVEVAVPLEPEATCRGAAVLALVEAGVLDNLDQGSALNLPGSTHYHPREREGGEARYRQFEDYLHRLYQH